MARYTALTGMPADSREAAAEALYPPGDGVELLLSVAPSDFSASLIARAVEDCDRHLVNLNVMARRTMESDRMLVAVRIDAADGLDSVERSLERYGFSVEATSVADQVSDDEAYRRVAELLHILEM